MTSISNATVSFRDPATNLTISNVPVRVHPAQFEVRLTPLAANYDWAVTWDAALTYTNGRGVAAMHKIVWPQVITAPGHEATLDQVRFIPGAGGVKARYHAFFSVSGQSKG